MLATSGLSTQPPVHAVCAAIRIFNGSWQQIAATSDTCMIAPTSLTNIAFISRFVSATIKRFAKVCRPRPLLRAGSCLRRLLFWSRKGQILAALHSVRGSGCLVGCLDNHELSIRGARQTAEVSSVKDLRCVPLPRQSLGNTALTWLRTWRVLRGGGHQRIARFRRRGRPRAIDILRGSPMDAPIQGL